MPWPERLAAVSRPAAAADYAVSIIVGIEGALLALYAMRQVLKAKAVPAPVMRRRR